VAHSHSQLKNIGDVLVACCFWLLAFGIWHLAFGFWLLAFGFGTCMLVASVHACCFLLCFAVVS
jgi:hypothetical protein